MQAAISGCGSLQGLPAGQHVLGKAHRLPALALIGNWDLGQLTDSMRCVSLLPSATEVVQLVVAECATGDGAPVLVGRSHECDYPAGLGYLPMLTAAK